ncbi:MAG TPA: hypothetical protein VGN73_02870, partial [Gemmatimonadaceae bacterium]|nr:hypothetical protein [Gemmatimonadaceae bacterium]
MSLKSVPSSAAPSAKLANWQRPAVSLRLLLALTALYSIAGCERTPEPTQPPLFELLKPEATGITFSNT